MIQNDGVTMHVKDYHNWIARSQYNRRMKGDPMLITTICAGVDKRDNQLFLGWSNSHGLK